MRLFVHVVRLSNEGEDCMDFFNKAKDSFALAGKGFTQKASDISGIARVSVKIKDEEKEIEETVKMLGTRFYNEKNDEAMSLFPELVNKLKQLYEQLEADKVELAILKGKKICPNCGIELESELMFCTSCGINVENVVSVVPEKQTTSYCMNCGNAIVGEAKFCMNCGTKVQE